MDKGAWWAAIYGVWMLHSCRPQQSGDIATTLGFLGFPGGSDGKESTSDA